MKMTDVEEFYVGYNPEAPDGISKVIGNVITLLLMLVVVTAILLAFFQRQFSTAQFEYGKFTTLEGTLNNTPVPHLRLKISDQRNSYFQNVILVGTGKAGAAQIVSAVQKRHKLPEGATVSIQGILIYGDGKAMLQIDLETSNATPSFSAVEQKAIPSAIIKHLTVQGEIVDPKCYFGVMKPGEGKAHRACAIRCISGGIPPVLRDYDTGEYYILEDEDGQSLNQLILPLVGEALSLDGNELAWADWKILRVSRNKIIALSSAAKLRNRNLAIMDDISQCSRP